MNVFLLLAAGFAGGLLARSVNFPGGAAIGAMIGVALVNLLSRTPAVLPAGFDLVAQVLVGVVIGIGISRETLPGIASVLLPAVLILAVLSLASLGMSYALQRWFGIDVVTALFSTAPGGITSMAILAKEAGGNPVTVAVIHLVRVLGIFVVIPILAYILRPQS